MTKGHATTTTKRTVHKIDASHQAVGRVATRAAVLLRGKHKATFLPYTEDGDAVHILNASKVLFTGKKSVQKDYKKHTMHPGGLKTVSMKKVFLSDPADVMRRAVYGMLPKNKHRAAYMSRLIIHA